MCEFCGCGRVRSRDILKMDHAKRPTLAGIPVVETSVVNKYKGVDEPTRDGARSVQPQTNAATYGSLPWHA